MTNQNRTYCGQFAVVIAGLPSRRSWEPGEPNLMRKKLRKNQVQPQGPQTLNVHPLAAKHSAVYTLLQCHQYVL